MIDENKMNNSFKKVVENRSDDLDVYSNLDDDIRFTPPPGKKIKIPSVAIVAVIILGLSSVIGYAFSNGTVDAVKENVSNTIHRIKGDDHLISDAEFTIEIDDLNNKKDMDIAHDLLPNLIAPDVMFDDYKFERMVIIKSIYHDQIDIYADIFYYDDDYNEIYISQQISNKEIAGSTLGVTYEEETDQGGDIYLSENYQEEKGLNILTYIEPNKFYSITGCVPSKKMLNHAKENIIGKL